MNCKVFGILLSFLSGDIRPKPIDTTSVAGWVGDVANGMMYNDFENQTGFGSLISAMSLWNKNGKLGGKYSLIRMHENSLAERIL